MLTHFTKESQSQKSKLLEQNSGAKLDRLSTDNPLCSPQRIVKSPLLHDMKRTALSLYIGGLCIGGQQRASLNRHAEKT
jgi:hypothetical protein